ncbi:putative manganese/iron superoxide dismutase [Plasmopara halstedii]
MLVQRLAPSARRAASLRAIGTRSTSSVTLPDLPYDFGALEPSISGQIMEIHHQKHHQAYVNNYNAALEQYDEAESKGDHAKLLGLLQALKFNGGGHVNHSIFWTNLAPKGQGGGSEPEGELRKAIDQTFGSFDVFKKNMAAKSAGVQGSGWGWLGYSPETKSVGIVTTANQDPCSTTGYVPLLGIDVWEHAYYLQYKNVRPDYLKAIWEVVNWKNVEERYLAAKK